MRYIDIENWKRKDHYNFFKQLSYPHFSISGNLEVTTIYKYTKENEISFFMAVLYAATNAANSIKEFRYRIREEKVVEHEVVHPSFTVMSEDEVFSFCPTKYQESFEEFKNYSLKQIEKVKKNVNIGDEPGQDDALYITSIPWISFTNITHPIQMNPIDSVPRISWGKYFEENGKIKMPISVQAHHALVDGLHVGLYFNKLQEIFDNPTKYFVR